MSEIIKAWRCIGCGRIEAPQNCLGVCQDRRTEIVEADAYRDALARADAAEHNYRALRSLVSQLARITPTAGHWQDSYEALQQRARKLLAETQPD